jgi:hypothetical protein
VNPVANVPPEELPSCRIPPHRGPLTSVVHDRVAVTRADELAPKLAVLGPEPAINSMDYGPRAHQRVSNPSMVGYLGTVQRELACSPQASQARSFAEIPPQLDVALLRYFTIHERRLGSMLSARSRLISLSSHHYPTLPLQESSR